MGISSKCISHSVSSTRITPAKNPNLYRQPFQTSPLSQEKEEKQSKIPFSHVWFLGNTKSLERIWAPHLQPVQHCHLPGAELWEISAKNPQIRSAFANLSTSLLIKKPRWFDFKPECESL